MSQARVFVPQQTMESWLTSERATLVNDTLRYDAYEFRAEPAVRFLSEVAGGPDRLGLLGRVKSRAQTAAHAAEHSPGAVLIGEDAYEVVDGYALSLLTDDRRDPYPTLSKLLSKP
jgi:hypothetical protein